MTPDSSAYLILGPMAVFGVVGFVLQAAAIARVIFRLVWKLTAPVGIHKGRPR